MRTRTSDRIAREYKILGRVQGVGFRVFVERAASTLGIRGWVRNTDDGAVEVYAAGTPEQVSQFAGHLWKGPRMADVRHVDEKEAAVQEFSDFHIRD